MATASHRIGDLNMAPCLGLIRGVIIDQPFAERGRISRLPSVVAQNPRQLGAGIDEKTAIIVRNSCSKVLGGDVFDVAWRKPADEAALQEAAALEAEAGVRSR